MTVFDYFTVSGSPMLLRNWKRLKYSNISVDEAYMLDHVGLGSKDQIYVCVGLSHTSRISILVLSTADIRVFLVDLEIEFVEVTL